eukprot:11052263-Alexandrium_andersonii.AAC.1
MSRQEARCLALPGAPRAQPLLGPAFLCSRRRTRSAVARTSRRFCLTAADGHRRSLGRDRANASQHV